MAIEYVNILQPHSSQALVEAGNEVFSRSPFSVRSGPHQVARLRRDDQLVAVRSKVLPEDLAEVFFGGSGRRAVIVRQIEMGDAEVECMSEHRPRIFKRVDSAEIVPESKSDRRQLQAAASASIVRH